MRKKPVCPLDTGRNLNVHKTFRNLMNVLFAFNLRPVFRGYNVFTSLKNVAIVLLETLPNTEVVVTIMIFYPKF